MYTCVYLSVFMSECTVYEVPLKHMHNNASNFHFISTLQTENILHVYCHTLTKGSNSWQLHLSYISQMCLLCTLTSMQYHYVLTGWVFLLKTWTGSRAKLGLDAEHTKSNLKTSLLQIWVICHLLPFVRVGQYWLNYEIRMSSEKLGQVTNVA